LYRGEAAIDHADDLTFDNRRLLAFEARLPDRILLVDGEQGRSIYQSETYYLETALRLDVPLGDEPPRTYEIERIVWDDGEGFPDLTGFRAIVLCNLGRFTATDVDRLLAYLNAGGNLLVFSGDRSTHAVLQTLAAAGVLPLESIGQRTIGPAAVSSWQKDHPLLRPFADPQHGDLRRLIFHAVNDLATADASKVLMAAGDRPVLVEHALGQGIVLFMGTTADRAWNDWPQGRLYVPLVRQMLAYVTGQLGERRNVQTALVENPGQQAGIEQRGAVAIVRNIDPRESQLDRVTEAEFRRAFNLPAEEAKPSAEAAAIAAPPGAERPDENWTTFAWLLLAVLAVETLLASRVHA
jgi:hypothetical protein